MRIGRFNNYLFHFFFLYRTHVRMKDHSSDHEFFSESLCGNRRSRIVEIDSTEIDVYVEQHHEDEDVPFDGAYAIVNGDMESGTFGMADG